MRRAASLYQSMDVQGMSGPRLVVFLYSQLVSSLRQGQKSIEATDHETRCRVLCRARDIVYELAFSLDRVAGGAVAGNLATLYEYFIHEITQIDLHPDAPRLARLIDLVATLHQAWETAAQQLAGSPDLAVANG